MSQLPGAFHPRELEAADAQPSDADLATAWTAARELEAALPHDPLIPSAGFADRVMAAVALEPAPRPAGFLAAFRARPGLAGLVASVREAWTVASAGVGRPVGVRGLALAYVLAIAVLGTSLTGLAAVGAAGALGLLDDAPSPAPSVQPTVAPSVLPSATPSPDPSGSPAASPEVSGSPAPTGTAEPSQSVEPAESEEPDASDDGGAASPAASPDDSPEPSDDGGASPSPSFDDDSAEPSDTPRPSDTPKPSQTPH